MVTTSKAGGTCRRLQWSTADCPWEQHGSVWLISTIGHEGARPSTEVDLADGDYVRGDLAIHRANGDDVCCERVITSDANGYLTNNLRQLQQFLPDTCGSVERGDTTPRVCGPNLRKSSAVQQGRRSDGRRQNRWAP